MGLWSALKAVGTGDFSNAGNYLFTSEEDIQTKQQVDNAQEALVKEREAAGSISDDKAMGFLNDIQRNAYPVLWADNGGPSDAFTSSLKEQVKILPNALADSLFKRIPWYVWLLILGGLFIYVAPYLPRLNKK